MLGNCFLAPFWFVLFSDVSARASRRRVRQDHTVRSVGSLPRDFHVDSFHIWPDARAPVRGLNSIPWPNQTTQFGGSGSLMSPTRRWRIKELIEYNSLSQVA